MNPRVGEIIRVRGYEGILMLVTETTEQLTHDAFGFVSQHILYTCQNIDNYKQVELVFCEDIISVEVLAEDSNEFIDKRVKGEQKPYIESKRTLSEYYTKDSAKKEPIKTARMRTPREEARIKKEEAQEYVDYLLDRYAMLGNLEEILGADGEWQEEMKMIRDEFHTKSAELSEEGEAEDERRPQIEGNAE